MSWHLLAIPGAMSCVVNPNPNSATASLEALMQQVIARRTVSAQRAAVHHEQFNGCYPAGR